MTCLHGIRLDHAVGVDGDEVLALAPDEAGVQALFLAPVLGEADGLDQLGVAPAGPVNVNPGVVFGAVVDADDLQPVGRVVGGDRGVDGLLHHGAFVVSRDDDGDPGQRARGQGIGFIPPPQHGPHQLEGQVSQGEAGPQGHQGRTEALAAQQLQVAVEGAHLQGYYQTGRQD